MTSLQILPEWLHNTWDWVSSGASVWLPIIGEVALWVLFLIIAGIGVFIVMVASIVEESGEDEDDDGPRLPALQNLAMIIQAIGGGIALVTLYFLRHWIYDNLIGIVVAAAILFATWLTYVYLQERRQRARRDTAIRQTQRTVGSAVEDWVQAVTGAVFVVAAIGLSVLSGVFQSAGSLDRYLAPILSEIGYFLITAIGYVQLGGDRIPGSGLMPELNALQWVGIALVIFAFVVVFRN